MRTQPNIWRPSNENPFADLMDKPEPTPKACSLLPIRDSFAKLPALPIKTHNYVVAKTADELARLNACAQLTVKFSQGEPASELARKVAGLSNNLSMRSLSREGIFNLRREMWEAEKDILQVRKERVKASLETLSKDARENINVLTILQTLLEGNFEVAQKKLGNPMPSETRRSDLEILHRFDPQLLKAFASVGVCRAMKIPERSTFEGDVSRRRNELERAKSEAAVVVLTNRQALRGVNDPVQRLQLETALEKQGQLKIDAIKHINAELENLAYLERAANRQVFVRGVYYGIEDKYLPLLDRVVSLLDETSIGIAARARLEKTILESIYKEHVDLFTAFGVIDKLASWQYSADLRKGFADPQDYLKIGSDYYRLSNSGLHMLKDILAKDELSPPPQKVASYQFETIDEAVQIY
jgi:hypothetical protein